MDLIVPICTVQLNNVQNIKVTQFDSIVEHRTLGTGTLKYRSIVRRCHSCNNDCCVLLFLRFLKENPAYYFYANTDALYACDPKVSVQLLR